MHRIETVSIPKKYVYSNLSCGDRRVYQIGKQNKSALKE